jgi:adenylate cyclase
MAEKRVQRRLAAIIVADVVAYSRMMEKDEAGTLERLKTLRADLIDPRIAADGGRIVKTVGDGLLVEFPSAVDAVRNALDIQGVMARRNADLAEDRRMEFRVGINLGDVIIEGDDIHGDGVNVAARLEGLCEPGGVYVSGSVFDQVDGKLDAWFDDLGEQTVKNLARPVRVFRAHIQREEFSNPDIIFKALPFPDKPSIAVLPFDNMSGDPEQVYFSDGITEDIITELSRFRTLFVIARNSSFTFRGKDVDVKEVGRKLGVHYVVEGSVRKAGNKIRVTAQLVDTASGHHLWAERYDRNLEDIFAVQDEVTRAIVSALPGRLEDAGSESAARKPTESMTAYDYVLLGVQLMRHYKKQAVVEARVMAQKAVELDPRYARAHALIAMTHLWEVPFLSSKQETLDEALKSAERAVSLDGEDSWSHAMLGLALFERMQDEEAEIHSRRAITLNPNDADAYANLGVALIYFGKREEGLGWIANAMRLNPFAPWWYHWYRVLGLYPAGEYEQAIQEIRQIRPIDRLFRLYLGACYAKLGRMEEAQTEIAIFVEERRDELAEHGVSIPEDTIDLALERVNRYRSRADRDHLLDGLRKAGMTG